jgi:hypothetical protein
VGLANLGSVSETCVGSRVRLVGVFISFEKNFYRHPFTTPSLVCRIGPSASSIDGSMAPCFNSTLFGDTMAAAWVQKNARWDGFPSSQFSQINSPKRNTLETAFSLFKLPSGSRKGANRGKIGANRRRGPNGPVGPGRPAHPVPGAGPVPCPVNRPF